MENGFFFAILTGVFILYFVLFSTFSLLSFGFKVIQYRKPVQLKKGGILVLNEHGNNWLWIQSKTITFTHRLSSLISVLSEA